MKPLPRLLALLALSFPLVAHAAPEPETVTRILPDGLRVIVRPRHTAPVVTTMMWYRVGSRDELPGQTGIAHFLEHLMFKGTKKLKKGEIDRLTYQNGGSNNAFTSYDYTAYEFNFPKETWKTALRIEADRMRNCAFNARELDAERQVVMDERRIGQDDPEEQFSEQLEAMGLLAHPYRNPIIGWMEDLKRLTRDQVYAFYQRYYAPANCTLVITGDVSPGEAVAAAQEAFAAVPKLPAPKRTTVIEPQQIAERRLNVSLATQVPRLEVLFPAPNRASKDVYALQVLLYALTEGKLSRIYQRLVDRDELAADADGGLDVRRDLTQISFDASAREGVTLDRLESALWEELERVRQQPLTPRELARAKNQFTADWVQGIDTANDLATVLGEADALGGYQYADTLLAHVQAVTAAEVQRAAQRYLRRDRGTIGYLLPNGKPPVESEGHGGPVHRSVPLRAYRGLAARAKLAPPTANTPRPTPSAFPPLHPVEKVLPNGMRLILLEKHDVPSVTLSVRVDAGSMQDTDEKSGLANLVARMLDEGTGAHTERQISEQLEQVGATFEAAATKAITSVDLKALSKDIDGLLPLYAELLRSPSFPDDRLQPERGRLLVELQAANDDAGTVARNAFYDLVYGTHPAHRPVSGTATTVPGLTRADLLAFHRRFYRPDDTVLVAVGDFQSGKLLDRLSAVFGDWQSSGESSAAAPPSVPRQTDVRTKRITMDKTQTEILLGHLGIRRTNPDYTALEVLDAILGEGVGGGFTARIPYQLRDVQGLAYSVGSSITSTAAREPGVFVALMGTEPAKEKVAIAGLLKEIRRIRQEPVTPTELSEAESYLSSSYVFDFQTNDQLAAYLDAVQYYGLGYNYRQKFVRDVRKVTRADVLRVARKYLDPAHYTLVVVGPGSGKKAAAQ